MQTIESYDQIPYDGVPVTDTHPVYLSAIGKLLGLTTGDAQHCRLLELGCAAGGNLIPMAAYLPHSRFVGIDLSARQVADGKALIEQLGLPNVTLMHQDIFDFIPETAAFDFIVVHGVYSWVPAPVQQRILDICAQALAPGGLAYVSFNVMPGWHTRYILRDMLLQHTVACTTAGQRLTQAHEFLTLAQEAFSRRQDPEGQMMLREIVYLQQASPSYFYHEYLEERNEALTISEFMTRVENSGLAYLGDTELHTQLTDALGEQAANWVQHLRDRVAREQYMDFLSLRRFRRALLCRPQDKPSDEMPTPQVLTRLAMYADLKSDEEIDLASHAPQVFVSAQGDHYRVASPLAKASLMYLSSVAPDSIAYLDLLAVAEDIVTHHGDSAFAGEHEAFQTELFKLVAHQAVRVTSSATSFFREVSERPRAHALARTQAAQGPAASVRHVGVDLDTYAARFLDLLDGTRSHAELVEAMQQVFADVDVGGAGSVTTGMVTASCDRLLALFARNGLLDA